MNQFGDIVTNELLQLFLMIPVLLCAFYVAVRITSAGMSFRDMIHSRPRLIACIILTVLGAGCLSYLFLSHLELQVKHGPANRLLVWISGVYTAFFMYFLLILTVTDIVRFFLRHSEPEKKKKLAKGFMAFSVGLAVMLTVVGVLHARNVRTIHYKLSTEGRLTRPLRVVEVSDLHMGSVIDLSHVQRVVDEVNARHPDIVVFLGDQFNRPSTVDLVDETEMFEALSHIEAPLGAYAVLGNHDPELDSEIYQRFLSEGNIKALDNSVIEAAPNLVLAGRTKLAVDPERLPLAEILDKAGLSQHQQQYLLVLDHDPNGIREAVSCDTDLVVAGHTHRGQFFPTTLITQYSYEKGYFYGLAETVNEVTGHITTSIVSSGAGYFQTPIRIGTDSEIVCVDLE